MVSITIADCVQITGNSTKLIITIAKLVLLTVQGNVNLEVPWNLITPGGVYHYIFLEFLSQHSILPVLKMHFCPSNVSYTTTTAACRQPDILVSNRNSLHSAQRVLL